MAKQNKAAELIFQQHIRDFLVREHKYGVLEQSDITDTEHFIAEDQLWTFLKTTQADTLNVHGSPLLSICRLLSGGALSGWSQLDSRQ